MKKLLFVSALIAPMTSLAQYQSETELEWNVVGLFLAMLICIALFFVCRSLICWYYKINQRVNNQERIIELLESINKRLDKDLIVNDNSNNLKNLE